MECNFFLVVFFIIILILILFLHQGRAEHLSVILTGCKWVMLEGGGLAPSSALSHRILLPLSLLFLHVFLIQVGFQPDQVPDLTSSTRVGGWVSRWRWE